MADRWKKFHIHLPKNHGWRTSKRGNSVFVADRGAVQFEFPRPWIIEPTDWGSIMLRDHPHPNENVRIEVSLIQLYNADGVPIRKTGAPVDWGIPLIHMYLKMVQNDPRDIIERGKLNEANSPEFEAVWQQIAYMDTEVCREIHSRTCFARANGVVAILTLDFWTEYSSTAYRVWREMMGTLKVGDYISDPTLSSRMN